MRSDDIVNVMYRENFPRFNQSACSQRFFNSEKAMQGNKIRRQIAFAELRSATSSVGSRLRLTLEIPIADDVAIGAEKLINVVRLCQSGREVVYKLLSPPWYSHLAVWYSHLAVWYSHLAVWYSHLAVPRWFPYSITIAEFSKVEEEKEISWRFILFFTRMAVPPPL
ncbi:hypothetical protein AVEN_253965-1 [Araneus ventricosus]|uniref:Uncharacterized protein n=1 Tax=Araneus ventricosus TaxID=182803 RepID=A0A4Y2U470_ARAVE|nr:hypothetical protein AVEN_3423-1 [Araneus ventricosus]GBO06466.1 hypothetical protein AVEN_253965-1 [Araneus ventricosus]